MKREEEIHAVETPRLESIRPVNDSRRFYEELNLRESRSTSNKPEPTLQTRSIAHSFAHSMGIWKSTRAVAPSHFTMKISSFSLFSKNSIDKYWSKIFESGGHKWQLWLFPNGEADHTSLLNPNGKVKLIGKDYMSLYLAMVDTELKPTGWEVNVLPELFLYNQTDNKYVSVSAGEQDRVVRFHELKKQWGHDRLISLSDFKDPSNGFLVNDTCMFGAEVFVCTSTRQSETFSAIHNPTTYYTWKIGRFSKSKSNNETYDSELLNSGDQKCWMQLKLKDQGKTKFCSLSLYFKFADSDTSDRVLANSKLRLRGRLFGRYRVLANGGGETRFFGKNYGWGFEKLMKPRTLGVLTPGFLLNNTLVIEAGITVLGSAISRPNSGKGQGLVPEEGLKLTCPICVDIMTEETSTPCGHIFCKSCITKAISLRRSCPNCRKELSLFDIHPIYLTGSSF